MGSYSTVYISREKAISFIHAHINELCDNDLEKIIDIWLEKRLYYTRINPEGREDYILD
ncbi:MAG: hypothetical protein Q7R95_11315 [bacterium]|nr:hypothetical protein [bacterium]